MLTFKQYIAESFQRKNWRASDKIDRSHQRLQSVQYTDADWIKDVPVRVYYSKHREEPRRAVNVDFDVNNTYHRPNPNSNSGMWRDYEKARAHLPSIMRRVKKSIETFAAEKKPNQIHMQANDESKVHLYKTFAHHLAKKHGGHVEEIKNEHGVYKGLPKLIVHLPGKKKT